MRDPIKLSFPSPVHENSLSQVERRRNGKKRKQGGLTACSIPKPASEKSGNVEKGNKDEVFRCNIARAEEVDTSIEDAPVICDGDFVLGVRPEFIRLADDKKADQKRPGCTTRPGLLFRNDQFFFTSQCRGGRLRF